MAQQIIIKTPETKAADGILAPLVKRAESIQIKTDKDFDAAWIGVQKIDAFLASEFIKEYEQHCANLAAAHKSAVVLRDRFVKTAKAAKQMLLQKRVAYSDAKEREARAAREREEQKAREQQIKDAEKIAKQLKKAGDKTAAKEVVDYAKNAPVTISRSEPAVPKTDGSVVKVVYLFEIVDPSKVPAKYRPVDESLVRKDVNAFGLDADIPGVRIWEEKREHSRPSAVAS